MKYFIISDIHANLEALEAALGYARWVEAGVFLSCGDIVGYGPNPNECVEKVKTLPIFKAVLGNHDAVCCGLSDIASFNEYAGTSAIWTRQELLQENKEYLAGLPRELSFENITLVHGSPRDPLDEYLLSMNTMAANMDSFKTQLCFAGHTHRPCVYMNDGSIEKLEVAQGDVLFRLRENARYIINTGSVGQPRDGDPGACCAVYDNLRRTIEFKRVKYDIEATRKKMIGRNLPVKLVDRLPLGV